ncbi:MAG: septum site-determining protein MinC [Desulfobacterales bacterium]|nr:septum site-determining protein MinC [Desulfobacterales bacterium]MBF0398358.1 septum site-determining protein MinC [Desulfobacterales bacterium]
MDKDINQNQSSVPVRLKGVGDSLWVSFDPTQPIDVLQSELRKVFERMKQLVVNSRVILDPGDQEEYRNLIEILGGFLKDTFNVGSVSPPPKKRINTNNIDRQKDVKEEWHHHKSDVLMLAGRVRSGQKVTAKKNLIILGDVNPGGEVIAGGDIIIIGCLFGTAAAGQPDNEESLVFALDFRPTQVQIGGFVAAGLPSSCGKTSEFAIVENGSVVVKDYLKANPFSRLPWPEAR